MDLDLIKGVSSFVSRTSNKKYFSGIRMKTSKSSFFTWYLIGSKKNCSRSISGGSCTLKATLVERPQTDVEGFLAMLRFENRNKVEELISV